jgi:hypothetical protein
MQVQVPEMIRQAVKVHSAGFLPRGRTSSSHGALNAKGHAPIPEYDCATASHVDDLLYLVDITRYLGSNWLGSNIDVKPLRLVSFFPKPTQTRTRSFGHSS